MKDPVNPVVGTIDSVVLAVRVTVPLASVTDPPIATGVPLIWVTLSDPPSMLVSFDATFRVSVALIAPLTMSSTATGASATGVMVMTSCLALRSDPFVAMYVTAGTVPL